MIANIKLRNTINDLGITYRMIANQMMITPEHLSRVMAKKLTPRMEKRILEAIEEITAERNEKGGAPNGNNV